MKLAILAAIVAALMSLPASADVRCYQASDGSVICHNTGGSGYNPWSDYSGRNMR